MGSVDQELFDAFGLTWPDLEGGQEHNRRLRDGRLLRQAREQHLTRRGGHALAPGYGDVLFFVTSLDPVSGLVTIWIQRA